MVYVDSTQRFSKNAVRVDGELVRIFSEVDENGRHGTERVIVGGYIHRQRLVSVYPGVNEVYECYFDLTGESRQKATDEVRKMFGGVKIDFRDLEGGRWTWTSYRLLDREDQQYNLPPVDRTDPSKDGSALFSVFDEQEFETIAQKYSRKRSCSVKFEKIGRLHFADILVTPKDRTFEPPARPWQKSENRFFYTDHPMSRTVNQWCDAGYAVHLYVEGKPAMSAMFTVDDFSVYLVQIQGTKGNRDVLKGVRAQQLLAHLITDLSKKAGMDDTVIFPGEKNRWVLEGHLPLERAQNTYDRTAQSLGFRFDEKTKLFLKENMKTSPRKTRYESPAHIPKESKYFEDTIDAESPSGKRLRDHAKAHGTYVNDGYKLFFNSPQLIIIKGEH